jgi:hypothetical protein
MAGGMASWRRPGTALAAYFLSITLLGGEVCPGWAAPTGNSAAGLVPEKHEDPLLDGGVIFTPE